MTLNDLASLGSFISGVAVLISLIYLSLQVRQAERNQQALIRQGRTERTVTMSVAAMEPSVAVAIAKGMSGADDISLTEFHQYMQWCSASLRSMEDGFYQHKEGLLSESAFGSLVASIKAAFAAPGYRTAWGQFNYAFQPDFIEFVGDILAKTPTAFPVDRFVIWKAGVAAEKSKAGA